MIDKSYDIDLAMAKAAAPVYAKALAAAHDAFYATESSNSRDMMRNAIRAYLAASPSPSEMDCDPDGCRAHIDAFMQRAETAEAQVLRLTEENEALKKERTSLIKTKREQLEAQHRQHINDLIECRAEAEADKASIKALEDALNEIRELNTTGVDENGHRWSHSDLIDQVIIPLRIAHPQKEQADG